MEGVIAGVDSSIQIVPIMRHTREYDTTLGAYLSKDYSVINIRQHLPRVNKTQTSLDGLA